MSSRSTRTSSIAPMPAYREARRAFFEGRSGAAPASTTVQVPGLVAEGALLEVGVTAIVPPPRVATRTDEWVELVATHEGTRGEAQRAGGAARTASASAVQ